MLLRTGWALLEEERGRLVGIRLASHRGYFGTVITVIVGGGGVNHHRWLVDRHGQRNWQQLLDNTEPA